MLSYKTQTRPGLVALYDIRPGKGSGLFLLPPSPHVCGEKTHPSSLLIINSELIDLSNQIHQ